MPLIHTTDFEFGAYVPNRDDAPNSDIIGNEPVLQGFIDEYAENCLVQTLGWELWSLLKAELDTNGDLDVGADQIWKDLVEGKDNYKGMLKGMLVGYVYFYWLQNDIVDYSTGGTHRLTPDSAVNTRPDSKMVLQYQKFYTQAIGSYNTGPKIVYKPFGVGVIYGSQSGSNYISMYEFLRENDSVYPTWSPNLEIENINVYDI